MKRLRILPYILAIIFLLNFKTLYSQTYSMVIHFNDGTTELYSINDISKITFALLTNVNDYEKLNEFKGVLSILAYPNPFKNYSTLTYELKECGTIEILIFDLKMSLVKNLFSGSKCQGLHKEIWDGTNDSKVGVKSGLYLYQIVFNKKIYTTKVVLIE